jgi:hypothetical protein
MLTEIDIERIMAAQKQLTESLADICDSAEMQDLICEEDLFEISDYELSVSETNGLM